MLDNINLMDNLNAKWNIELRISRKNIMTSSFNFYQIYVVI